MEQEIKTEEVKPSLEKEIKPIKKRVKTREHKEHKEQEVTRKHKDIRESITLTLDKNVLEALKSRAEKKHLPVSRVAEEILREKFRLS